jgi:hypothetical protein
MKAFLQGSEPLQWKGGRMHVIPKKSNMMRADAMRGIMVLTSCGKLYHALLRRMLLDWTTSMRLPAQMGGFCGQHTSFATHLLRTYCNLITQAKMSEQPFTACFVNMHLEGLGSQPGFAVCLMLLASMFSSFAGTSKSIASGLKNIRILAFNEQFVMHIASPGIWFREILNVEPTEGHALAAL